MRLCHEIDPSGKNFVGMFKYGLTFPGGTAFKSFASQFRVHRHENVSWKKIRE